MAEMVAEEAAATSYDPEETPFAYQLELTEMLSAAAEHKVDGNARFKRQDYSSAQRQYTAALKGLACKGDLETDVARCLATRDPPNAEELAIMVEELAALRGDCHVNAAACLLKLKDFESAATHCEDALTIKPDHKKALFRLGLAYEALDRLKEAEAAFTRARAADPDDKQIAAKLKSIKARTRDDLTDNFGGLFKKEGYGKARSAASRAKRERDRRDFEFTKRKYLTHLTDVLERCLKFTGDAFEDYGLELEQLADAGARKASTKDKPLHASLAEPRKRLWKLFYVAARRHKGFRITAAERDSCDACHVDVPSNEILKFEKKHGPPEWLKYEKDPMAKDLEIHEEMRDAMEDPDEKSQWAKMVKVREKMGKGPPVMLPYESKEKTDKLISSMSGAPYDPNTAISSHDWDKYEDPTKCAPNAY